MSDPGDWRLHGKRPQEREVKDHSLWWDNSKTIEGGHDDHGLDDYLKFCKLTRKDLEGKTILDLGIGKTNRFSREVRAAGIKADVWGLSPDLIHDDIRQRLESIDPEGMRQVLAGTAQQMPFEDNKFDLILSVFNLSFYHFDRGQRENIDRWMSEVARVLKPGGEIRLAPSYAWNPLQIMDDLAQKHGLEYTPAIGEGDCHILRKTKARTRVPAPTRQSAE